MLDVERLVIDMDIAICENTGVFDTGDLIRKLRKQKGWTQEELGVRAGGLNKQTVNRIENGHNATLDSIERIAVALGTTTHGLLKMAAESVLAAAETTDREASRVLQEAGKALTPAPFEPPSDEAETADYAGREESTLSAEAETLGRAYDQLRDVSSRRLLLEMAERFRAAEPQQPAASDSSHGSGSTTPATADEELPRIRKIRGA